jgi:hypothetical protein
MTEAALDGGAVDGLRAAFAGDVIMPGESRYDEAG